MIDLLFTKKIIFTQEGEIYIKLFFKWKVHADKSYLIIEDIFVPSTVDVKNSTLVLYRNSNSFISRLFKNKIKLHSIDQVNLEQIKDEAQKISEMFGIEFRDIYEFK